MPPFTTDGTFAVDRVQLPPALPAASGPKQVGPPGPVPAHGPILPPTVAPAKGIKQVSLTAPEPLKAPATPPSSSAWGTSMPTMLPALPESSDGNPYPYPFPLVTGDGGPKAHVPFGDAPNQLNPLSSHFYASGEYLLWWTKKDTAPALVSTSTDGSGVNNRFGFLNQPSTTVLFGGPYGGDASSGFRGNIGYWLDTWCEEAVELGGFFLAPRTGNFSASSDQYNILARPFFNANSNQEFAELVAFPGISTGHVVVSTPSSLWGIDSNLRCNVCMACDYRFDLLAGFRYLNLYEGLNIAEVVQGEAGARRRSPTALTTVNDSFTTHNQFYGGQIGFDSEWKHGAWSFDVKGKLALGATQQQLNINGVETITPAGGATSTFNGGLLALPSNIGSHNKTEFSVVPEVGLTLGYQLTSNVRLYAGYNFLYWTHVIRPGQQIDRNLDVTQIPNFNIPGSTPTAQTTPVAPLSKPTTGTRYHGWHRIQVLRCLSREVCVLRNWRSRET